MIRSGYFNRSAAALTALCERCGDARWGDAFDGTNDAFNNRYNDESGDWCWTGGLGGMVTEANCSQCGGES